MTFVVIYDANVLYPSTLRDVLIRLAQTGLVQAKWTETILDETFRSLHAKRPGLDQARLRRTRELMNLAVRDAVVTGFEPLIDRSAATEAGLWDDLGTSWVLLDCELLPWSAKAKELLREQYAAVGAAARAVMPVAVKGQVHGRGV